MSPPRWSLSQKARAELLMVVGMFAFLLDGDFDDDLILFLCFAVQEYYAPGLPLVPRSRHTACFARFNQAECWRFFRFRKHDLHRLLFALGFPSIIRTNTCVFSPEEALLLLLRRLAYPNRFVDLVDLFGLYEGELSSLFTWTVEFLFRSFGHLLDALDMWQGHVMRFCEVVHKKGVPQNLKVWCFVDGTIRRIARPSRGQQSQYSGHRRIHGLKFESVSLPNGIIARLFGPVDGRRHDITMARLSGLYQELRRFHDSVFQTTGEHVTAFADSAYSAMISPWLLTGYKGAQLTSLQHDFNSLMSKVRVSVEWCFGDVIRSFAFLDFAKNLKVLLQPVAKLYIVGCLLSNCRSCLYGNITSEFFGCETPTLENYLRGQP